MSHAVSSDAFVDALLRRAPQMQVFQLCRLLEARLPSGTPLGASDSPAHEPLRFLPDPGMGFPGTEVKAVERDRAYPERRPVARTTFLGLYGVDAAMPPHLVDDIVLRRDGHDAVMAFLDQFNHRIAMLMYRAWRKYRYPIGFLAGGDDERSRDLLCLAGLGLGDKPGAAGLAPSRALSMLGLLNQRTRTSEGIAAVVALAAPGVDVTVDDFFPQWVRVPAVRGLVRSGAKAKISGLGQGTLLGRRLLCRHKAVRITLWPAEGTAIAPLLPGGAAHADILGMLRLYVGIKADAVLRMRVETATLPLTSLGTRTGRLGWTCPLKPSRSRPATISLGRYEAIVTSCTPAATGDSHA